MQTAYNTNFVIHYITNLTRFARLFVRPCPSESIDVYRTCVTHTHEYTYKGGNNMGLAVW